MLYPTLKSSMTYNLGAIMVNDNNYIIGSPLTIMWYKVKGGKIVSTGYNHQRPHYDGNDIQTQGHRKPVSMHAEMHAIFNVTGMSPSFKKQVQGAPERQLLYETWDPCATKTTVKPGHLSCAPTSRSEYIL